jgi:excisionase family DNA binding protein
VKAPTVNSRSAPQAEFLGRIRAAEILDISPQTLDKLIRDRSLRAFRVGRSVKVRRDELIALMEKNQLCPSPINPQAEDGRNS